MTPRDSFNWSMCGIVMSIAGIIGAHINTTYWAVCMISWCIIMLVAVGGSSDAE